MEIKKIAYILTIALFITAFFTTAILKIKYGLFCFIVSALFLRLFQRMEDEE